MPCNAGRPIGGRGFRPFRVWMTGCPDADRRSIEVPSSMADSRRRREWSRPTDKTDTFAAVEDDDDGDDGAETDDEVEDVQTEPEPPSRTTRLANRFGEAVVD